MRKKIVAVSTMLLIILATSITFAWFSNSEAITNKFNMGTIKVEVYEPEFKDLTNVKVGEYEKEVLVVSKGTKKTYVRVRLIPEWSEPSLPISNVQLNLNNTTDWVDGGDGHYYYKYYLTKDQETSLLLESVTFTSLGSEYDGKTLTIKVVAEGVQITNDAWKYVWGLTELPFPKEVPKPIM